MLVHVGEALQGLEHDVANHLLGEELSSLTHQLINVQVKVFEHKMKGVLLEAHFVKPDDVRVGQLQQRLDLLLVDALVPPMVLLLHLFDRHDFTCSHIKS